MRKRYQKTIVYHTKTDLADIFQGVPHGAVIRPLMNIFHAGDTRFLTYQTHSKIPIKKAIENNY